LYNCKADTAATYVSPHESIFFEIVAIMKTFQLLHALEFHDNNPYAEPLLISKIGHILRCTLWPGQVVREHSAPHFPVYIIILQGTGLFAGADGREHEFGPNMLLTFEPGKQHAARALDENLVFVVLLHEAPKI
jgi:quercetin dioxygenase-like cupin family protein